MCLMGGQLELSWSVGSGTYSLSTRFPMGYLYFLIIIKANSKIQEAKGTKGNNKAEVHDLVRM